MQSINPSNGEVVRSYQTLTRGETNTKIVSSGQAFQAWQLTSFDQRSLMMHAAAHILKENAELYARLMAVEMGKPLGEGRAEAEKCAWVCAYYADTAQQMLQAETISSDATKSYVTFQPLGVILAVMPWNFPFWQVFRFAAPALMAGNVGLLKHASNVPGCALAIEEVFKKAGFPENVFTSLLIGSDMVGAVIDHTHVKAVTLTGSTPAGRAVAQRAGSRLKKTVLELGGSDAYVILEDADLEKAVTICVTSRLLNGGQSCIAAKRFIVVEKVKKEFEQLFVNEMRQKTMGDPFSETSDIGPQARRDLRDELHQQVFKSIKSGAICLLGGEIPPGKGAYYPPTVLTDVTPGMPAYEEELFGPVAAIIVAKDEAEAIRIANDSVFGLGAAVFTRDVKHGEKIAAEALQAGSCFINAFVRSDPRLPFGGIKESGYGRELSHYGIKEFVNIKTVYVGA
jgi:succinate-semialdehyde dehydrogenase/glutarate-semialdehyde dehydrogenase